MIGVGLLLALVVGAGNPNDNSAPTCGGKVMQPGDACGRYKNGVQVGTSTYQEKLDEQHDGSPTVRIIGWGLVGLGVLLVVPMYLGTNPGAKLHGADLTKTNLELANLTKAILSGANLTKAKALTREQLDVALCDSETRLPAKLRRPDSSLHQESG